MGVINFFLFTIVFILLLNSGVSLFIGLVGLFVYFLRVLGNVGVSVLGEYCEMGINFSVIGVGLVEITIWIIILIALMIGGINDTYRGFFLLFLVYALLNFFFVEDVFYLYFYFECSLVPIFWYLFSEGGQVERVRARIYIFMYTVVGSLPYLIIILSYPGMLWVNFFVYDFLGQKWGYCSFIIMLALFLAFLVKLPIFGVHYWLPKAHVEAPVAGSMLLAAVLLKMGGFGLIRVIGLIKFCVSLRMLGGLLIIISLWGAVFLRVYAFYQVDLKVLVAYSSVVHIGLLIAGVFSGTLWGGFGSYIIILGHGFCSSALFCLIGFVYDRYHTRNLIMLRGLITLMPALTFFWFIFCMINIAVPPFMSFFREVFLIGGVLKWSVWAAGLLILISFFRALYTLFLFSFSQHGRACFSWAVRGPIEREYLVIVLHLIPLVFFILKSDFFFYIFYLNSLIKMINCGFIDAFCFK